MTNDLFVRILQFEVKLLRASFWQIPGNPCQHHQWLRLCECLARQSWLVVDGIGWLWRELDPSTEEYLAVVDLSLKKAAYFLGFAVWLFPSTYYMNNGWVKNMLGACWDAYLSDLTFWAHPKMMLCPRYKIWMGSALGTLLKCEAWMSPQLHWVSPLSPYHLWAGLH